MALVQFVDDSAPYLNAQNLNNNFEYLAEKNIMTATFTTNHTIASTNAEKVNLNSSNSVGTKLTLNNGSIVIGSGVSKIKVSVNVNYQTVSSGEKQVAIYKNDSSVFIQITNISQRTTLTIAPILIDVQEGDTISLYLTGAVNDVIRRNMSYSNMTVEVVE